MSKTTGPRCGSLQFHPRKRAKRPIARIRHKIKASDLNEFAGYKAGMTHVHVMDTSPTSNTKNQEIVVPVTVIECPPLKVLGIRAYNNNNVIQETMLEKPDKNLAKKITLAKKKPKEFKPVDFDEIRLIIHTQPTLTNIGKKKPEIFEICLGGSKEEQMQKAAEMLGKEINIKDVFNPGEQVDIHSITRGKGNQGPVKRFGVAIRASKSEKTKRGPGSLGPWKGQGHIMWKVAYSGQMGYHQRTEHNKLIVGMDENPETINPKGGFLRYGVVKNNYILFKGSIGGSKKRLIRFTKAMRPNKHVSKDAPQISYISIESKQ